MMKSSTCIEDDEIKHMLATSHPYGEWCREHIIEMDELVEERGSMINDTLIPFDLKEQQKVFGYTQEDLTQMIVPMARMGKDPVGAMGIDAPLPVLSERPQMLYDYFQQNFAQVTNPPIDGVRESIVTSSRVMIGNVANIMEPDEKGTAALEVLRPILTNREMAVIKNLQTDKLRAVTLSMLYPVNGGAEAMETAIESICIDAYRAIRNGANILVLSDRGV